MILQTKEIETTETGDAFLIGFRNVPGMKRKAYPAWRYHRHYDPIIVSDTTADLDARAKGFDEINAPIFANFNLINWFWDIEDMSPKQLSVFAKDEFEIDLPQDASQDSLQAALFELSRFNPKNVGRLVLMAQTIKMNFEATQEEIRRAITNDECEVTRQVVEM